MTDAPAAKPTRSRLPALLAFALLWGCSALHGGTVDACGHDLSSLHSTVVALDPATGRVAWTTEIPLAEAQVVVADGDELRVRLAGKDHDRDARVTVDAGAYLGTVEAHHDFGVFSVPEDLPDAAPPARAGDMRVYFDGRLVPWYVDSAGVRISRELTDPVTMIQGTELSTGAHVWAWTPPETGVSFPALVGNEVVVVTNDARPVCV